MITRKASNTTLKQTLLLRILASLLLVSAYFVEGFHIGGKSEPMLTRTYRRMSTNSYDTDPVPHSDRPSEEQKAWLRQSQATEIGNKDEEAVDDYLEFLDRRYRRLHDDRTETKEPQKAVFSAWKWLKQDNEVLEKPPSDPKTQEDALYVLGVAGLASKKLLQKRHLPVEGVQRMKAVDRRPKKPRNAIDVATQKASIELVTDHRHTMPLSKTVGKLFTTVSGTRHALHKYQQERLADVSRKAANAPVKLAHKLWALGGGTRNVQFTAAAAMALTLVLVRPVVGTMVRETWNITRGA